MAISLDVANVGQGTGDFGGAANPTASLTTSSTVAAGGRLFVTWALNLAGGTGGMNLPTASGLTFVSVGSAADSNGPSQRGGVWYADCPAGLASGATISWTSTITTGYWWATGASSFVTDYGWHASAASTANTATGFSTTAWATTGIVTNDAAVIFSGISCRQGASSTPTSPGLEIQDFTNSSMLLVHQYRIEATSGTYTNAGTFGSSSDGFSVCSRAYKEAAPPAPASPVSPNYLNFPKAKMRR